MKVSLPEAIRAFIRKAVATVFRVRGSVLCDGESCVSKHMSGKSVVSRTLAENQHRQSELREKLAAANRSTQIVFRTLCDEISLVAKNGNGGCGGRG